MKFLIGGNWKLNGNLNLLKEFSQSTEFIEAATAKNDNLEVLLCPAFPYLGIAKEAFAGTAISIGAQNCHSAASGAYTGEVSTAMLKDFSVDWVILGHSERRNLFGETDEMVGEKVRAALATGMRVILCIGEGEKEREDGETEMVLEGQLEKCLESFKRQSLHGEGCDRLVIAYEPVWAIGTGKVATPLQAQQTHHHIRQFLVNRLNNEHAKSFRIIYGGSVGSNSSGELAKQPDIDGFLVGGASLKLDEFTKIINSISSS